MDQVRDCRGLEYQQVNADGNQVNIVVPSKEPAVIAAALADAWVLNENNAEQIVVWAWSDESVIGTGFDRGVASEQGVLGELLVFEVCTTWDGFEGIGEICGERVEFTIEQ